MQIVLNWAKNQNNTAKSRMNCENFGVICLNSGIL